MYVWTSFSSLLRLLTNTNSWLRKQSDQCSLFSYPPLPITKLSFDPLIKKFLSPDHPNVCNKKQIETYFTIDTTDCLKENPPRYRYLDLFVEVPSSTPRSRHEIANWSGFLIVYVLFQIFVYLFTVSTLYINFISVWQTDRQIDRQTETNLPPDNWRTD